MGDHDALFKRVFRVPAHAAGELRSVLPPSVSDALALDELELVPGSFVDAALQDRHTDLLFRAPLRATPNTSAYIYFLFEHQSEPDELMPFRLWSYSKNICDEVFRLDRERKKVPLVVGVVVHHGRGGWTKARRLHEIVDGLEHVPELAKHVPDFELCIDDLGAEDDAKLQSRPLEAFPKITLWLLRDTRDAESFIEHIRAWASELQQLDPGGQEAHVIVNYVLRIGGDVPAETIRKHIVEVAPALEKPMASAAEQLIQQGLQRGLEQGREEGLEKGLEQGLEQGLQQGRAAALRHTLERLLQLRFGPLDDDSRARVASAPVDELERFIERVISAGQLDEVFGG